MSDTKISEAAPAAWLHEEDSDRVVSAAQKATAIRDGGASASSVKPYTIAAYTHPQPAELAFDVEEMLTACVPGGNIVDPQLVADNIRAWVAKRKPAELAEQQGVGDQWIGEDGPQAIWVFIDRATNVTGYSETGPELARPGERAVKFVRAPVATRKQQVGGDVEDDRFPSGFADAITYVNELEELSEDLHQVVFGHRSDGGDGAATLLQLTLSELKEKAKQVGEVQGDALSLADHITDHLCHHEYDIGGRSELLACVTEALAARQPGAQVPYGWLISGHAGGPMFCPASHRHVMEANATDLSKEIGITIVEVYATPPAQGIDLGQQEDAARWRWVREQNGVSVSVEEADDDGDMAFVSGHTPEELDAAIDGQRDAAPGVE